MFLFEQACVNYTDILDSPTLSGSNYNVAKGPAIYSFESKSTK